MRYAYDRKVLCAKSLHLCPTVCNPLDCRLPSSSVHWILQARILEWVAISFSRKSSWPRDWICISWTGRQILYCWATREDAEQATRRPYCRLHPWRGFLKSGGGMWANAPREKNTVLPAELSTRSFSLALNRRDEPKMDHMLRCGPLPDPRNWLSVNEYCSL